MSSLAAAAKEQAPVGPRAHAELRQLAADLTTYVDGELDLHEQDWVLLAQCNDLLSDRYAGLTQRAAGVRASLDLVEKEYEALAPYFSQIEHLESNLTALEGTVKVLDDYSRALEAKFCAP